MPPVYEFVNVKWQFIKGTRDSYGYVGDIVEVKDGNIRTMRSDILDMDAKKLIEALEAAVAMAEGAENA